MSTTLPGKPSWLDLTVDDAVGVRDFYRLVCGWTAEPHDMGEYVDYAMTTEAGETVAGICHARGTNAALPAVWLPYVSVSDLEKSVDAANRLGGHVIDDRRSAGFVVIRDPAGAYLALMQLPTAPS